MIGIVQMYDSTRRYGFLRVEGSREQVFLHAAELEASKFTGKPVQGERLKFEISHGERGARAMKIARV